MDKRSRPSILVFAYACGPTAGSEFGAGWGMVRALSEFADLVVLTGSKDMEEIRRWERSAPQGAPTFIEVPDRHLGRWMKWHRIPEFLLYLLWLRKAEKVARATIASQQIDATFHATFSAYWLPTPSTRLGVPSIWGPVGGGVTTPRSLWSLLGWVGIAQELLDLVAVRTMAALPATRRSARQATEPLLQNQESLRMLPPEIAGRSTLLNHSLFSVVPTGPQVEDGRYALWVSPMESRKGPRLVIEALAQTQPAVRLIMVGDGPQRAPLEKLANHLGVAERVEFTGWVDRSRAVTLMRGATTTVFTGLREEGGLALAEAMNSARRVIVLDHGGAGTIARRATDKDRVALIATGELPQVVTAFAAAIDAHFAAGPVSGDPLLDRDLAQRDLVDAVSRALTH